MSSRRPLDSEALRAARLRAGLTQHELAQEIGVAGGERISRWELGKSSPQPRLVSRLADVLKVDPAGLLERGTGQEDLRELRTSAGLSLRTLAGLTHVSKTTLVRWELDGVTEPPTAETLRSYAAAVGVTPEVVRRAMSRVRD